MAATSSSPASSAAIAKLLQEKLVAKCNLHIRIASQTRDVGVDAGGGPGRATRTSSTRITKGVKRLDRIRSVVKMRSQATKLIKTGAQPSWCYCAEAYGLTDAKLAKLRAATADAAGRPGAQGCPIMTIQLTLGGGADPLMVANLQSVKWWLSVWHSSISMEAVLRKAWHKARGSTPFGVTVHCFASCFSCVCWLAAAWHSVGSFLCFGLLFCCCFSFFLSLHGASA